VEPMQTYSVASARERLRISAPMACAAIRSDTRLPRGMSRLARRMAFPAMAGWRRRAGLAVAAVALLFGAVSSCGSAAGYDGGGAAPPPHWWLTNCSGGIAWRQDGLI
jgi:hypothetical protein